MARKEKEKIDNAFSFRLTADETKWILSLAEEGENKSSVAKRLIQELYEQANGLTGDQPTKPAKPVSIQQTADSTQLEDKFSQLKEQLKVELASELTQQFEERLKKSVA